MLMGLCEAKTADGAAEKCGHSNAEIRITFLQNQHFKNDDSTHELSLKSELKPMRLSSILTRTKMSKFAILNQNGSSISTPSVSSR